MRGHIAEILIWDRVLGPAERDALHEYLDEKYQITPAAEPHVEAVVGVQNLDATAISIDGADLNVAFQADGAALDLIVYWGSTDGGMNPGAWANSAVIGSLTNLASGTLAFSVSGLLSSRTWFTFRGTNCLEDIWGGPSLSFQVQEEPDVDHGAGADPEGGNTAILHGELIDGGAANIRVYWGTADGGMNPGSWDNVIDLGVLQNGLFSATVTELLYGVRYYYRAFADNVEGSMWAPATTAFKTHPPLNPDLKGFLVKTYDDSADASLLDPIANLMAVPETNQHVFQGLLKLFGYVTIGAAFPSLTQDSTYSLLMEGQIYIAPDETGLYTFGTRSDDGSMLYIDLNRDGDFADPGEAVVDNNGNHAGQNRQGVANLDQPGCYPMAIGFYENLTAEQIMVYFRKGTGWAFQELHPMDLSPESPHPFYQSCPPYRYVPESLGATDITGTSAVLNIVFDATDARFDLDLYWGETDGGADPLAWDNSV
ncbi:MAG: PA14 domain-containing protein, partial [Verrucomicrobiota bacterium]